MKVKQRLLRDVLRDKRGISTSMPEVMAGVSLKAIVVTAIGGVLAAGLGMWAVSSASADASSGFQAVNVSFEKQVRESDVVIGAGDSRVGLLMDSGESCKVEVWQSGTRDGKTTLRVDTTTVAGVCTPTTPLPAPGASPDGRELLYDIAAPTFEFANLGGRALTFSSSSVPTLVTGIKPDEAKTADWNDVRPHRVQMTLQTLSDDASVATKKGVATGFTNVMNVSAADDSLRYVPAPSDKPVPGPVSITAVERSSIVGDEFAGVKEGIRVTFAGAVCASGPSKVVVSYTQLAPSTAPPVTTVVNKVLTGGAESIDLGTVRNGSTGTVEAAVTCVDGGVEEKQSVSYTQPLPPTVLTVTQNEAQEKHDLSWIAVSSLPTSFELRWTVGTIQDELLATTSELTHQAVNKPGANLGLTSSYSIVASVADVKSPKATAEIANSLPAPRPSVVLPNTDGANWTAVSCPAYSTAQYAERHYQQSGKNVDVNWSDLTPWSTDRGVLGIDTPEYGRTVYEVHTRCVGDVSGGVSEQMPSTPESYYVPEALTIATTRSTTTGQMYGGAREGALVLYSGGRCYGDVETSITVSWQPEKPSGNRAQVKRISPRLLDGSVQETHLQYVRNGEEGEMSVAAKCAIVKGDSGSAAEAYAQPLPPPNHKVEQGKDANEHIVSWYPVSSLVPLYTVTKVAAAGTEWGTPRETGSTTTSTYTFAPGTTYGNRMDYTVTASLKHVSSTGPARSITTPWPAAPAAQNIGYSRTGEGGVWHGGRINWSFQGACPAATTHWNKMNENRHGRSDGSIDTAVRSNTGWGRTFTSAPWWPGNSYQGYAYGVGVDSKCISNVTGIESPILAVQSANWITPMQTPATPIWDSYNFREWQRGTNWTYSTCHVGDCPSMSVEYRTFCSPGSWVNWSTFSTHDWTGARYHHPFGFQGQWGLVAGGRNQNVTYYDAKYSCGTPWAGTLQSPTAPNFVIEVRR